ncbi:LysR substrate-binding domain-containing protein [Snodgrassella sp. CFCC 13594]|uniref:LysR substrate-binding domain-containing protein n=1 Tax=Snodgrassella sp. CFCC 13594 TaxID=1775559 RepID=UPI000B1AF0E3|nr:LysR substrate-binding domain-containing protein [Snodgrassella sp. CFCC 13594]
MLDVFDDHDPLRSRLDSTQFAHLHTFFVVARLLSFQKAANTLFISASAVSHRISKLESALGFRLFVRLTRRIALTQDGLRIFNILNETMAHLANALQPMSEANIAGRIAVYARPSFARCWLMPRLAVFAQYYPEVCVDVRTGNDPIDFRLHNMDLAIEYAGGDFVGFNSEQLLGERMTPVCSPQYAAQHHVHQYPERLTDCVLLHDAFAWPHAVHDAEWQMWWQYAAQKGALPTRCFTFDSADLCLTAALNHVGVAIGREQLVSPYLDSGLLVKLGVILCLYRPMAII